MNPPILLDGRPMTNNEIRTVRRLRALKCGLNKLDTRAPDRGHGTLTVEVIDGWESTIRPEFREACEKRC